MQNDQATIWLEKSDWILDCNNFDICIRDAISILSRSLFLLWSWILHGFHVSAQRYQNRFDYAQWKHQIETKARPANRRVCWIYWLSFRSEKVWIFQISTVATGNYSTRIPWEFCPSVNGFILCSFSRFASNLSRPIQPVFLLECVNNIIMICVLMLVIRLEMVKTIDFNLDSSSF